MNAHQPQPSLAELAVATVLEGCLGETVSAALAAEALLGSTDEAVRHALQLIRDDELRHAQLAWRTVRWALSIGDAQVFSAVQAAFRRGLSAPIPVPERLSGPHQAAWEAAGVLAPALAQAVSDEVRSQVLTPCAQALLTRFAGRASASAPG